MGKKGDKNLAGYSSFPKEQNSTDRRTDNLVRDILISVKFAVYNQLIRGLKKVGKENSLFILYYVGFFSASERKLCGIEFRRLFL